MFVMSLMCIGNSIRIFGVEQSGLCFVSEEIPAEKKSIRV